MTPVLIAKQTTLVSLKRKAAINTEIKIEGIKFEGVVSNMKSIKIKNKYVYMYHGAVEFIKNSSKSEKN